MPFFSFDVCFGLGLQVAGEVLNLEDDGGRLVNNLFDEEEIKK